MKTRNYDKKPMTKKECLKAIKDQSPAATHTPTPWSSNKQGSTIHIKSPSSGYTVALIESCTDLVYSQDEINAAFIVKAVNCHEELLEKLKNAIETMKWALIQKNPKVGSLDPCVMACQDLRDSLREAIAKAEGGK